MATVAVIAINITVLRASFSSENRAVLLGAYQSALMAVAAQVGLYLAARSRHHRRLFWFGFTASGVISALTLVTMPRGIASLWSTHFRWQNNLVDRSPGLSRFINDPRIPHSLISLLYYFAPQFVIAVVGGLLAVGIGKIVSIRGAEPSSGSDA